MDQKDAFATNLTRLTRQHAMTKPQLADATGIPYTTIVAWTKGDSFPRAERIDQLAKFFHINRWELLKDPDETDDLNGVPVKTPTSEITINKPGEEIAGHNVEFWKIVDKASKLSDSQLKQLNSMIDVMFSAERGSVRSSSSNEVNN